MATPDTINISQQQKEFMAIAKKIEDIKINIQKPLWGILQYTANGINKSFFSESIEKVTQRDIDNAILFLNSYLQQFKRLAKEVQESVFINDVQKKLFLWTLQSFGLKVILFKCAVYIEGEKWWYELNQKDKQIYLKTIDKIEKLVYWPKISEIPEEVDVIMTSLAHLYQSNKDKIAIEDQAYFTGFLEKFPRRSWKAEETVSNKNRLWKINQENFAKLLQKWLNIYGIASDVLKISEDISEIKQENGIIYLPTKNPTTEKERSKSELESVYKKFWYQPDVLKIKIHKCSAIEVDIPSNEINIPANINYYSVIRSLELLSHEIVTHAVTWTNKKNKFNLESDTYLELQEWIAMLNEKAVTTEIKNISVEPTVHHISTFIWENYDTTDTNHLLQIYYKLQGKKNFWTLAKNRTERVKRFHANDQKWANGKDIVYRRGITDSLNYIQNLDANTIEDIKTLQQDIFNFNVGKLGKNEIKNVPELIEWFDITPQNIILPADIGKLLLWLLEKNSPNGKWIKITNTTLWENDIRFKASLPEQNLNYQQKKLLLEMRHFIENIRETKDT